jgi:LmbE family N-acetylglucosaminyl deacetylase
MRDRETETIVQPRERLSLLGIERALCVAPHPDDEVLGCGGLLAALVEVGCTVHTLILTCGGLGASTEAQGQGPAFAELTARRREESTRAAAELGTPPPQFLNLEDRGLRYGPTLVEVLSEAIQMQAPQVLLLPSLSEPHPDHQATALAGLAAARAAGPGLHTVLFYEAGAPLQPNVHVPIDAVAQRKWRAVQCFTSQLDVEDYESHAKAMAALRAFGLRPPCREAEAFFRVDLQAVREKGALAALPQWPWARQRLHLANDPAQLPLVSVLVRSMNRDCLPEALASVALQSHTNLELVVVNASGRPHRPLDFLPGTLRWHIVEPPTPSAPCGRARAANLALEAAQGNLALFLDDDDLLEPLHLERLVAALKTHPRAVGAYAGVRVETHDGAHLRDYDLPWSRERLQGVNFLPIHAVLFRMDHVRQHALRFDESLPVLEDWHFWLQLTEGAELAHCPGVSAVYRQGLGQSSLGDAQHPHHWRVWHRRLLRQWVQGRPAALRDQAATDLLPDEIANRVTDTLAWHAVELDRTQAEAAAQAQALRQASAELHEARSLAAQHQAARDVLQQELAIFRRESQAALAAREAALQLQAAEAARQLAEREAQAQRFAAATQRELDALQARLHQQAAEQSQLLRTKEAELQRFGREARQALEAKEAELQRFGREARQALEAKEAELQRFGQEARQALEAKEAELQRVAAEAQAALDMRDTEHAAKGQRLEQALAVSQADSARLRAELAAIHTSRSWRWTAPLRRGHEGTGGAGA